MKTLYFVIVIILVSACTIDFKFLDHDEFYGLDNSTTGDNKVDSGVAVTALDKIRLKAYYAAEYYLDSEMEYELGGDDEIYIPPYTRGIDCSGLIIDCYIFAVEDTDYSMPFKDKTADNIYHHYSSDVIIPQKGDLIFWTDESDHAYHIALYEKTESNKYYFIESNYLPKDGINGVAYRSLSVNTTFNITIKRFILIDNS